MNKWEQLEDALQGSLGCATVIAGGHEVSFYKRLDGERLVVETYVDGWIKGEWMKVDAEGNPVHSQGRFWCPIRRRAWKLKEYPRIKKAFGKKEADRMTALKTMLVSPAWKSPRSLVRHLKKHFPDLELKTPEASHA